MTFPTAVLWPALKAAGMLNLATVKSRGAHDVDVGFRRPGEVLGSGIITTDYAIEYQTADLPRLAEAEAVTIWADAEKTSGEKFKVREAPLPQGDGYFSVAVLTKL